MMGLLSWCDRAFILALVAVVIGSTLSAGAVAVSPESTTSTEVTHATIQSDNSTDTPTSTPAQCEGRPQMDLVRIAPVDSKITPDQSGTIEGDFRLDPSNPEDCTVIVKIEYRLMDDGFQFEGGADWDQPASTLVTKQFELSLGVIQSLSAQINPNGAEVGDELTVVANVEVWYEGSREDSAQINELRQTLIVIDETATPSPGEEDDDIVTAMTENPFLLITLVSIIGIIVLGVVERISLQSETNKDKT